MPLSYTVTRFDSNHLEVSVNNPNNPAWMFYSDVWHPFWKAKVNGRPVKVFKANLAYKAIPLVKGQNKIHFYFKSNFIAFLHYIIGFNSLFWLGFIGWSIVGIIREKSSEDELQGSQP